MDILRRNTDYAVRAMVNLAEHHKNNQLSTRTISAEEGISYQLTCKLMQKLHNAKLVESCMGSKGGFRLSREPSEISLLAVIEAIQGRIVLNRCLLGNYKCPKQDRCKVRAKLAELGKSINSYLSNITLDELSRRHVKRKGRAKNFNGRKK